MQETVNFKEEVTMKKLALIAAIVLAVLSVQPVGLAAANDQNGEADGRVILREATIAAACRDDQGSAFIPAGGLAWHMSLDEAAALLQDGDGAPQTAAQDKSRTLTMPNGHISFTPNITFGFQECDLPFDVTYVFSETGLYACNLRATIALSEINARRETLTALTAALIQAYGEAEYTGESYTEDYSRADFSAFKSDMAWFQGDTFLSLQAVRFRDAVYVDVNTGITSYFAKYAEPND